MSRRPATGATVLVIVLSACSSPAELPAATQDAFLAHIADLCGQAFAGQVVSNDAVDAELAAQPMVMHVRDCEPGTVRIPFHVGDDRSRTWILSRTMDGLRLKHDHRHRDGTEDAVTLYGGDTDNDGTANRQEFPADETSRTLFVRNGLDASVDNTWAVEIHPRSVFAYEMRRPGRFFRVEFDLTRPVAVPPPAWGPAPG